MPKHLFKSFLVIWCLALFSVGVAPIISAQTIQPKAHPNHYIILIDASGSTVAGKTRKETYYRVLTEILPSKLYDSGFGNTIPPYDPSQDSLTLLNFGIVPGTSSQSYMRLREVDFSKELIHPVFIHKPIVKRSELEARIIPTLRYQYTLLSWARTLALTASSVPSPDTVMHRTFLIMVHDGLFNENSSPQQEKVWVQGLQNPSFNATSDLIDSIEQDYQFTDGQGRKAPAWPGKFPENNPQIFIEVYQVISTAQAGWESEITKQKPISDLDIDWEDESGNAPEGILSGSLNSEFVSRFQLGQSREGSLALLNETNIGATGWDPNATIRQRVKVSTPLSCEHKAYETQLRIPFTQTDRLLGTRTVDSVHQQQVSAPPALHCRVEFYAWLGGIILLATAVLMAAGYFIWFRFFATHIIIKLPGSGRKLRINRSAPILRGTTVSPKNDLEAFSLHLPSAWLQHLFYKKAFIIIETRMGGHAYFEDHTGRVPVFNLPTESDVVVANWEKPVSAEPTELIVIFEQGARSGQVSLYYPKGVNN